MSVDESRAMHGAEDPTLLTMTLCVYLLMLPDSEYRNVKIPKTLCILVDDYVRVVNASPLLRG